MLKTQNQTANAMYLDKCWDLDVNFFLTLTKIEIAAVNCEVGEKNGKYHYNILIRAWFTCHFFNYQTI